MLNRAELGLHVPRCAVFGNPQPQQKHRDAVTRIGARGNCCPRLGRRNALLCSGLHVELAVNFCTHERASHQLNPHADFAEAVGHGLARWLRVTHGHGVGAGHGDLPSNDAGDAFGDGRRQRSGGTRAPPCTGTGGGRRAGRAGVYAVARVRMATGGCGARDARDAPREAMLFKRPGKYITAALAQTQVVVARCR